jgi:uncharacterized protein DUF6851/vanadium-dependent haloperoxidase-like protein
MESPKRDRRRAMLTRSPRRTTTLRALLMISAIAALGTRDVRADSASIAKDTGQVLMSPPGTVLVHRMPSPDFKPTVAYQWLEVLLEASGRDAIRNSPRPTILSRTMAIVLASMYEAWAPYDDVAVGTQLGGRLRRPPAERTQANKEKAISYAAYQSLLFVHPEDATWIREQLRKRGFDPDDASTDATKPQGIGNTAANAVIESRRHDGANQLGDESGGNGKPYADYTGYAPKNSPDHVVDPLRWMPIPFSDGHGGTVSPGFLTPQWGRVKPFTLERADQFRPPDPPRWKSDVLEHDIAEVMRVGGDLTLEQKTVVEFMREGPRSTGQSGHWLQFAQDVSRRDHQTLDQDVKLFFAVSNTVADAFIACWEAKRYYDSSRPYWWVRTVYAGKEIEGWAGPGKGLVRMTGERWRPYSPDIFLTPPFPGYTSGHATASGAASRILEYFTGSDRFGSLAIQQAGYMTEPDATTAEMQARDGRPATDVPTSKEVRLWLPTFTATAEMAAISRMWGGYHIRTDNEEGLILGRKIAGYAWPKIQTYFNGTAR